MNISDIARLAGVSKATVSRYLNDGYVSSDKRENIKRIIEETGYKPSSQARTLRKKRTGMIGVIIPKISSESVSRMVEGIGSILKKKGFKLLLADTANNSKEELTYLNALKEYNVDGIILLGTVLSKQHRITIEESEVPVVVLAQQLEGSPCVYYDDFDAAKSLTDLMVKTARKIAYIGVSNKDRATGKNRYDGFMTASRENNIDTNRIITKEADYSLEAGYEQAGKILQEVPDVDTIVCATDNIALGAIKRIRELGMNIPQDIQIAGMGDSHMGMMSTPELTSIHYYYKTGGMEAAKLLLNMISGEEMVVREIKMSCKVVGRQTHRELELSS